MALHMRLMVNDHQIGYLYAQRREAGRPHDSDVCSYEWSININGETMSSHVDHPLAHRFGDGAWALVARVIEAAGHSARTVSP